MISVRMIALLAPFIFVVPVAGFSDVTKMELRPHCKTNATAVTGERDNCYSEWEELKAPKGFVFSKESAKVGLGSNGGSENKCEISWSDYREVVPGVTQPGTVRFRAYALSKKGNGAAAGWSFCSLSVNLVRLPG